MFKQKYLGALLGISAVLNVFMIAGGIASIVVWQSNLRLFKRAPPPTVAWEQATRDMPAGARERIKLVISQAALSGEPTMENALAIRKEAAKLAAVDDFDVAKVITLSDQARSYEAMARSKIEIALIQDMARLSTEERGLIAKHFLRPSFRFRKFLEADASSSRDGVRVSARDESQM
jgi:uncharacterized membrane protein